MNQNLSSYWIFIRLPMPEIFPRQPKNSTSASLPSANPFRNWKKFRMQTVSRSSRGVVLTDEGQLLYGHVKEAFETLTLGEDKLKRSIDLGVGHLQIGVSSTLCKFVLLPYLKEFIRQNPHISISINCQSTNETLDLLDENKIDIGLIGKPDNLKNINFTIWTTLKTFL